MPSLQTLSRIAEVLTADIKDLFISTKGTRTRAEVVNEIKRLADDLSAYIFKAEPNKRFAISLSKKLLKKYKAKRTPFK